MAGLVLGAVGLVTVFKEAYKLVKKHRQKRRIGLLGLGISDTAPLEHEIHSGESSLVSRYKGFHAAYGDAFARGDGMFTDHCPPSSTRVPNATNRLDGQSNRD